MRNDRVEAVTIPAFAYGIEPAAPAQNCETIGLRLLLVANKNVSSDALFDALRAMSDAVAAHTQVILDTTNANPEFPVHPGSAKGLAKQLMSLFAGEPEANRPTIAADARDDRLLVRGTQRQVEMIRNFAKDMTLPDVVRAEEPPTRKSNSEQDK